MTILRNLDDGVHNGRDEGEEADGAERVGLDAFAVSRFRNENHWSAIFGRVTPS